MPFSSGTKLRIIGKAEVDAKLLAAAPRILEQNRKMVTAMLEFIKPDVVVQTPLGPGRLGFHGRDSLKVEVTSHAVSTGGKLTAGPQVYWREFGTRGRYRGRARNARRAYAAALGGLGTGGEKAHLIATRALSGARKFIKFYYGGMAAWWRA